MADKIINNLMEDLKDIKNKNELMNIKSKYIGKKGLVSILMQEIKNLSVEEKKIRGSEVNMIKKEVENLKKQKESKQKENKQKKNQKKNMWLVL